jgi:phosphopantothenoylcysteine decarboxylase/phosphopantothenate--cysteine ligase
MQEPRFAAKKILLGVTGSIAAYKAVPLIRTLIQEGAEVQTVLTAAARQFVTPLTLSTVSQNPVPTDLFDPAEPLLHLRLAEGCDAVVVAPATAHFLAKAAAGLADDLLSTLLLAVTAPVVIVPAMDGGMWDHPAVRRNVKTLRERGLVVLEPEVGPLASGRIGEGRFPSEETILKALAGVLAGRRDLAHETVLITAGPTQEPLDPVRFLTNRSSGRMGYALAEAARDRGAQVVLISGPVSLVPPHGVEVVRVVTAEEMRSAVHQHVDRATVVMMAAAVSDWRPRARRDQKMQKEPMALPPASAGRGEKDRGGITLDLVENPDILSEVARGKGERLLVGFAAETQDLLDRARRKLQKKGLDLIVANDVTQEGAGFETETNIVTLLDRAGNAKSLPKLSKRETADRILDRVLELRALRQPSPPKV